MDFGLHLLNWLGYLLHMSFVVGHRPEDVLSARFGPGRRHFERQNNRLARSRVPRPPSGERARGRLYIPHGYSPTDRDTAWRSSSRPIFPRFTECAASPLHFCSLIDRAGHVTSTFQNARTPQLSRRRNVHIVVHFDERSFNSQFARTVQTTERVCTLYSTRTYRTY